MYLGKFSNVQLSIPTGLTYDAYGFVLVTESGNFWVSVMKKDGAAISSFGSCGSGHGQFSNPQGIAISPTGSICYFTNKSILIF